MTPFLLLALSVFLSLSILNAYSLEKINFTEIKFNSTDIFEQWVTDKKFVATWTALERSEQAIIIQEIKLACDNVLDDVEELTKDELNKKIDDWKLCANGELEKNYLASKLNELVISLQEDNDKLRTKVESLTDSNVQLKNKIETDSSNNFIYSVIIATISVIVSSVVTFVITKKYSKIKNL